ncbi:hypothetical protein [Neobacillus drentensis]|uniref:hypothetical protein n=1 Tax=Neobacillus drentensis TaxID=220684 RepID=UPI002FFDB4E9
MEYEELSVYEHWGNSFCGERKAKLYADGRLIYEPDPIYPYDEEETDVEEDDE